MIPEKTVRGRVIDLRRGDEVDQDGQRQALEPQPPLPGRRQRGGTGAQAGAETMHHHDVDLARELAIGEQRGAQLRRHAVGIVAAGGRPCRGARTGPADGDGGPWHLDFLLPRSPSAAFILERQSTVDSAYYPG